MFLQRVRQTAKCFKSIGLHSRVNVAAIQGIDRFPEQGNGFAASVGITLPSRFKFDNRAGAFKVDNSIPDIAGAADSRLFRESQAALDGIAEADEILKLDETVIFAYQFECQLRFSCHDPREPGE